jgi:hypothetical protein
MRTWLQRYGFSYKKPAVVPGKANFEDFKAAVIGFFAALPTLAAESALGQSLRSRVRDKFRPIQVRLLRRTVEFSWE